MRLTWLVLGVVVAAGAVAFINTDDGQPELPTAKDGARTPELNRTDKPAKPKAGFDLSISEEEVAAEKRAQALLKRLAEAQAKGSKDAAAFAATLRREPATWDAPSARRHAYIEGRRRYVEAGKGRGKDAIAKKDEARRLLSRALYLPEMFTAAGGSTPERSKLIEVIQKLNRQVMLYRPSTGIEGVTKPYTVPRGVVPVQIVSRQRLPMGPNAILFWNLGGNLNPKSLRADAAILLPQEELTLRVNLRHRRLAIFVGDWFVKEWPVGVGAEDSPTPLGIFEIYSKDLNPDWHAPGGKVIPWEDKKHNELGDAWMGIQNEEYPRGASYGIHGTNKPKTVGTRCSRGCVRLNNEGAVELRDWVRRKSAGAQATRVFIK